MKGELKMIRHYFRRTFILSLVFGMTIFLLPGGVFAQTTPIEVPIDIKPGSCPNPMNVKSRGVLPVAILGTPDVGETPGFDVTTIDPESIQLFYGDTLLAEAIRPNIEDVATPFVDDISGCEDCDTLGEDGIMDLTVKFRTQDIVAPLLVALEEELGEEPDIDGLCIVLTLTGSTADGGTITGQDVVRILKKGKVKPPKPPNPHKPPKD